jgi:phosphoglycerate kinase
MKSILEAKGLSGKKVLVRVDWNVPLEKGIVSDDFRIRTTLPTIEYLRAQGAKIIIASHLEGINSKEDLPSMRPVFEHAKTLLPLAFEGDGDGNGDADVLLLENLRLNPGEKANSEEFAQELASKADIYLNEAFSVSHREHASIVKLPRLLPGFVGLQFQKEVQNLSLAFYPKKPFLFILAGAKFDTKMPLIEKFVRLADKVFVGGALAHNFFKEQGREIGKSLVDPGEFGLNKLPSDKIILPEDVMVESHKKVHIKTLADVVKEDKIVDAGPNTMLVLKEYIQSSATVLWNGPLGSYEDGYRQATLEMARLLAEHGRSVVVGGGDTLSAIKELDLFDKFTFVSTGGGAMLAFLAKGTLPGIEALGQSPANGGD